MLNEFHIILYGDSVSGHQVAYQDLKVCDLKKIKFTKKDGVWYFRIACRSYMCNGKGKNGEELIRIKGHFQTNVPDNFAFSLRNAFSPAYGYEVSVVYEDNIERLFLEKRTVNGIEYSQSPTYEKDGAMNINFIFPNSDSGRQCYHNIRLPNISKFTITPLDDYL